MMLFGIMCDIITFKLLLYSFTMIKVISYFGSFPLGSRLKVFILNLGFIIFHKSFFKKCGKIMPLNKMAPPRADGCEAGKKIAYSADLNGLPELLGHKSEKIAFELDP